MLNWSKGVLETIMVARVDLFYWLYVEPKCFDLVASMRTCYQHSPYSRVSTTIVTVTSIATEGEKVPNLILYMYLLPPLPFFFGGGGMRFTVPVSASAQTQSKRQCGEALDGGSGGANIWIVVLDHSPLSCECSPLPL